MSKRALTCPFVVSLLMVLPACGEQPLPIPGATDASEASSGDGDGDTEGDTDTDDSNGDGDGDGDEALRPNWYQDIAPLFAERCGACHRDGGIGPFALDSYAQAESWAPLALEAVEAGLMPPWGQANTEQCETRHDFIDDPRLSDAQLEQLRAWVELGAPEGDPADAAPLPTPPDLELSDADLELSIPHQPTIEPGSDQFWCYVVDPQLEATAFIDAVQVHAGNDKVVHHVLVWVDDTGEAEAMADENGRYPCFGAPKTSNPTLLNAWAPGVPPTYTPEEAVLTIPAGAKLVLNIHYHPTGSPEVDEGTSVLLRYAQGAPQYLAEMLLLGNFEGQFNNGSGLLPGPNDSGPTPEFRIPAGAVGHTEEMNFQLPNSVPEVKLWLASTHMHYVGTDMTLSIDRAQPEPGTGIDEECLLQTPNYSFEWQRGYRYDAPLSEAPTARGGDRLYMRCTYDNSTQNPYVAAALAEQGLDEPVDVYLGDTTLDEMCLGVYGIAVSL